MAVAAPIASADIDGDGHLVAPVCLINALQIVSCSGIGYLEGVAICIAGDLWYSAFVRGSQGLSTLLDV